MKNLKSSTTVYLPFGTLLFTRVIAFDGREETMWQYAFDNSGHWSFEQCEPFHWKHKENRIWLRDLMVSEGGISESEANDYIRVLTKRQWAKRKGSGSLTIDQDWFKPITISKWIEDLCQHEQT